jgi:glyoxylase-like metal-dependent hydrolase (beta-lactamase superfamily II)
MFMQAPDVILRGKDNGEEMIIHCRTKRGTDIYGLGIPNIYAESDWDLGPTWCYLIKGRKNTLIDTGRFGNYEFLKRLLDEIRVALPDIDRIIITHSHEDHDGNLAEIQAAANAELCAHQLYQQMISYYPDIDNGAHHPELPGSCRLCVMPEKIRNDCLSYHQERSLLNIDLVVQDNSVIREEDLLFLHTPGHTPDSICAVLENEVFFTGDTILPNITPHPSLALAFEVNCDIFPDDYRQGNRIYGLMNYIKSLNRIAYLETQPYPITLPSHRLFFENRFNLIHDSSARAREIIRFHIDRCSSILDIAANGAATVEDIALRYFQSRLLKGPGKFLALNEISAHIEVMEASGDIIRTGENREVIEPTGTAHYREELGRYLDPA